MMTLRRGGVLSGGCLFIGGDGGVGRSMVD